MCYSKASFKKKKNQKKKSFKNNFKLISVEFTDVCGLLVVWEHPELDGRCWIDRQLLSCRCRWFWPHHQKPHKSTGYCCHGNSHRCTGGEKGRERDVTGDHVTRTDPPYIVTLKASDKRAGVVQAGNKLWGRKQRWKPVSVRLDGWPLRLNKEDKIREQHGVNCQSRRESGKVCYQKCSKWLMWDFQGWLWYRC